MKMVYVHQGFCVIARVNKVMRPKVCVLLKPFSSLVAVIVGIERITIFGYVCM